MLNVNKNKSMHIGRKVLKRQIKCSEFVAKEERMMLKMLYNSVNLLCAHIFNKT